MSRVSVKNPDDVLVATLAAMGRSAKEIQRRVPNYSLAQITYRLGRFGVKISPFRNAVPRTVGGDFALRVERQAYRELSYRVKGRLS